MLHSEAIGASVSDENLGQHIRKALKAGDEDAQVVFWADHDDVKTALETIEERCRLACAGVPNETRKGLPDGRTIFERVLPGPDRMYPDTDSAPIPIEEELIARVRSAMPTDVSRRLEQFRAWAVPPDTFTFLLKHNLAPLIESIHADFQVEPRFVATVLGHDLKHLLGRLRPAAGFDFQRLHDLFAFIHGEKLEKDIIKTMLPVAVEHPNMDLHSILITIHFKRLKPSQVLAPLPDLRTQFRRIAGSKDPAAAGRWIAGQLRKAALGNLPMREVAAQIAGAEGGAA